MWGVHFRLGGLGRSVSLGKGLWGSDLEAEKDTDMGREFQAVEQHVQRS